MDKLVILLLFAGILGCCCASRESREPCEEGYPCEASPGVTGICLGLVCVTEIPADERRNLSFTIVVKYPEDKLIDQDLYLRGNGLGLSWQQGSPLSKTAKDTWEKTIVYKARIDGFLCESCADETILLSSQKFQYRVLIGDSQDMLGASFALDLPISKTALPETPEFQVYPWFNSTTGTVLEFFINSSYLNSERSIGVYLPPSFHENPYKNYGALLVYDLTARFVGYLQRDIFDKYTVTSQTMDETILIGWGDFSQTERLDLLTPVSGIGFDCINGTLENRCNDCYPEGLDYWDFLQVMKDRCGYPFIDGGLGEAGLDFLVREALPKTVELTDGRLISTRDRIGILGFSLGGLMACHAAWTRPDVFGYAACQSSSFYWPINLDAKPDHYFLNVTLRDPQLLKDRKPQRIYIDENGVDVGHVIEAANRMQSSGFFTMDQNLWVQTYPNYEHTNLHWIIRAWSPISVLLAPQGSPSPLGSILTTRSINAL